VPISRAEETVFYAAYGTRIAEYYREVRARSTSDAAEVLINLKSVHDLHMQPELQK